jgi:ankyrin repeat protein
MALEKGHLGLAQLLLKHGADPNARGVDGQTLLHVSCRYGNWKVVRELLKLNVDVNSRDNQGRTPHQIALEKRRKEVVQLLLEHGAESTSPLHGADAETRVRVPALNDPGSLNDTLQADTKLYGATKRLALVARIQSVLFVLTMRRDMLRVGGSELRVFRAIHPTNQRNVIRKNWPVVRRRWLGVKTRWYR